MGGPRFVSATTQTVSNNITAQSTVWLFGASLTKKFERTSIQVNILGTVLNKAGQLVATPASMKKLLSL